MSFEIPKNIEMYLIQYSTSPRLPSSISRYTRPSSNLPSPDSACPPHRNNTADIYLFKSIPLTFRAMFQQYFQLASRIRKHYLSPRVLLCLLTGKFVPPINRKNLYSLQYSMLPARRTGIMEMWAAVKSLVREEEGKKMQIPAMMNGKLRGHPAGGFGLARSRGYGREH